jgi:hypothetical protein
MWQGVGQVPVQVRCRLWHGPVPVQMWRGACPRSRFVRSRCGLAAVGPQLAELGPGLERVLCCGCWHSRAGPGQVDRPAVGLVMCLVGPNLALLMRKYTPNERGLGWEIRVQKGA